MIHRTSIAAFILALAALPCVDANAEGPGGASRAKPKLEYLYMEVTGATTDQVAAAAQKRVSAVRGVQSFTWTVARSEAKIVRVVGQAGTPSLIEAFRAAGVTAKSMQIGQQQMAFKKALHCNSCVIKIKRALKTVKGTKEVIVAKDKLSVTIVYDSSKATVAQLKKALAGAGYPVQ